MEYITLVNAERSGDVQVLLWGTPKPFDLHWDEKSKRTQLCMRLIDHPCSWCDREQSPRAYHYVPCLLCELVEMKNDWKKAIVQLPMGFVAAGGVKLCSGRWLQVTGLNRPGMKPCWRIGKLDTRELAEPFDILEALIRIKGVSKLRPGLRLFKEESA